MSNEFCFQIETRRERTGYLIVIVCVPPDRSAADAEKWVRDHADDLLQSDGSGIDWYDDDDGTEATAVELVEGPFASESAIDLSLVNGADGDLVEGKGVTP